jgi:predicted DNA-binding transcriptional regulator YafY
VLNTSARLLRLLTVLSGGRSWTCAELAGQLGVTGRTVRRDVARLRELDYGIESLPGPWGGYRLGPGTRVPPLIVDDEEALAVAVGLRTAATSGITGGDQAALSALLKLRRVLPGRIADRLGDLDAAFAHTARPQEGEVPAGLLLDLATACRQGGRVELRYRDGAGVISERTVDPYRLVHTGRRWYLVAHDLTRRDWRTFRADRILGVTGTGQPAELPDPPDAAELVRAGLAVRPYPVRVTARLLVPMDEALRLVPPTVGLHRADGPDATVVEVGGPDAEGLARYLLSLGCPLRVLDPDEVRRALLARTRRLLDLNA